jgi:PTH1 family peptidyl-tRNA hydrolase
LKYLIVGLGNIGIDYQNTRHNIGFDILEQISKQSDVKFQSARYGDIAEIKHRGRKLILLKPSTYVNLSGKAIVYWLKKEKLSDDRLLVVSDDLALKFGKLRLRMKGGDAGHNGLKNINEMLGHQNYARLRFGISNEFTQGSQVDYVLGNWLEEEAEKLPEKIDIAKKIILSFASIGIERTMNLYNKK